MQPLRPFSEPPKFDGKPQQQQNEKATVGKQVDLNTSFLPEEVKENFRAR